MLTAERLRHVASYDPETGLFHWILPRKKIAVGAVAGTLSKRGYTDICVDGRVYKAHRLAWLYVHGEWPTALIDHINGDKADNRLANLREATKAENGANRTRMEPRNTSGHRGIRMIERIGKWQARAKHMGKEYHFGYFSDLDDAIKARDEGTARLFGKFYSGNAVSNQAVAV